MANASKRAATNRSNTSTRNTNKQSGTKRTPSKRTSTKKSTGTRNSRGSNSNNGSSRRAQTAPHLAPVQPSSKPRKVTMGSRSRAVSLRTDLQKFGDEDYTQEDFLTGTQLIIEAEAGERLRDLVASVLRSKGAFGNMQSEHVMEGLLDQLSKGYSKRRVAERKSIRAMLNWCSGLVQTEPEVEGELLRTVMSQGGEN